MIKKIPIKIKNLIIKFSLAKLKDNSKLIFKKFKVPIPPQMNEHPKRKIPEMKDPEIKYFKPASVENAELRLKQANTQKERACISIIR